MPQISEETLNGALSVAESANIYHDALIDILISKSTDVEEIKEIARKSLVKARDNSVLNETVFNG